MCAMLYNKTFKRFEPQEEETVDADNWFLEPLENEAESLKEEDGQQDAAALEQGGENVNEDGKQQ